MLLNCDASRGFFIICVKDPVVYLVSQLAFHWLAEVIKDDITPLFPVFLSAFSLRSVSHSVASYMEYQSRLLLTVPIIRMNCHD